MGRARKGRAGQGSGHVEGWCCWVPGWTVSLGVCLCEQISLEWRLEVVRCGVMCMVWRRVRCGVRRVVWCGTRCVGRRVRDVVWCGVRAWSGGG